MEENQIINDDLFSFDVPDESENTSLESESSNESQNDIKEGQAQAPSEMSFE